MVMSTGFARGLFAYGGGGRRAKPPLRSIPVGGPFERVGVDIMELPLTLQGNRYVLVFLDYLTKWVEAYPLRDQTSETVARVLVDGVICRHGVPRGLLSDGSEFSVKDICRMMEMHKINTMAYHPQTDGLVENFNRTLASRDAGKTQSEVCCAVGCICNNCCSRTGQAP